MTRNSFRPAMALAVGLVLTGWLVGCDNGRHRLPTQPDPAQSITRISIQGPDTLTPGSTAAYTVIGHRSDGSAQTLNERTQWFSSSQEVLSVDATGRATAHTSGDTRLSAQIPAFFAGRDIIVVPAGTYRLTGLVTENQSGGAPVGNARVEVRADGALALSTTTGVDGRYRFHGVVGDIELRVTKDGYQSGTTGVFVREHLSHNLELSTAEPRRDASGTYVLKIVAARSCRELLEESLRSRTYSARISHEGVAVDVRLSGAAFAVTPLGRGDRFTGRMEPAGITFTLAPHISSYYGYAQYPNIVEKLESPGWVAVDGTVLVRETPAGFAGMLEGAYQYFRFDPAWGGSPGVTCRGAHDFILDRVN
jgi:hypothetical protein